GVDLLVLVVELRERDRAAAWSLALLGEEQVESLLGGLLDGLHGPGAVEQHGEVGEGLVGHGGSLRRAAGRTAWQVVRCGGGTAGVRRRSSARAAGSPARGRTGRG